MGGGEWLGTHTNPRPIVQVSFLVPYFSSRANSSRIFAAINEGILCIRLLDFRSRLYPDGSRVVLQLRVCRVLER